MESVASCCDIGKRSVAALVSRRRPPCLIARSVSLRAKRPRVDVGIVVGDFGGFESTAGIVFALRNTLRKLFLLKSSQIRRLLE